MTLLESTVIDLIHQGHAIPAEIVDATPYSELRSALQHAAGWFISTGQDVRAIIALEEVKRLDSRERA